MLDEEISIDLRMIKVVVEWPIPKDYNEVKIFLGLANYYKIFVKGFSKIIAPMTNLLVGKSNVIDWTFKCDLSSQTLKSVLIQTFVLTIMDP